MAEPPARLTDSPVDFETAIAYALHPDMRRLIMVYIAGVVILPVGLQVFLGAGSLQILVVTVVRWVVGLLLTVVGATLLFGGLVGTAFKLVTDANRLAVEG